MTAQKSYLNYAKKQTGKFAKLKMKVKNVRATHKIYIKKRPGN